MKLRVLDEADADAIEAAGWYEERSPGLGFDFLNELEFAFDKIRTDPFRYPRVEYETVEGDVRRLLMHRFPYVVVFQIFDDETLILAVSHGNRDQSYWKHRVD
jgi:toxin ParE1/3/4